MNRLLKSYSFARAYVDDIVIFFKIFEKHIRHLHQIFDMLIANNIFIKSEKIFIEYLNVQLLSQKIDSFELATFENKLKTIAKLFYSTTLQTLEIYLNLIFWMREYVSFYADIVKSLQKLKTDFLRLESVVDNARKVYSKEIKIQHLIDRERLFFQILQTLIFKLSYLVHSDLARRLYVDLDASKKFDFDAIIYHVKLINWNDIEYSSRKIIQSIMFLSRLLASAKTRYWLTELKIADIVWILRKIRHLIEFSTEKFIIVYTDHDVALSIFKQISMIIISIDKLNLRLIKISDYIQRFELKLRHKSDKAHIILDALFKLASINIIIDITHEKDELNALFIIVVVNLNEIFRKRIIDEYTIDLNWKKISQVLNSNNFSIENSVKLSFYKKNGLIFRFDDHVYESHRLCISWSVIKNILKIVHDNDTHSEFARCYEKIVSFYYIRDLIRYLRNYLKHCSKCQIYQTRRHKSYESLQLILTFSISFHTIIVDFVLALSIFKSDLFDYFISVTCKYFKRVLLISSRIKYIIA